jgi:2-desacetyl-2-hydroxyethyl bacteriochlorophyllide A dehydrogenase
MRTSLIFVAPGKLDLVTSPLPAPSRGEVLVRTLISAISPGTEMLVYRGQVPAGMQVDETLPALQSDFRYPLKYGYSVIGEVVQLGPDVSEEWEGKLVFCFHPHESHFTHSTDNLIPVPAEMSLEDAASLPNMETAVNFLMDGTPVIGEKVLVFGQGLVGLLTTALLARMPLSSLVTLDYYQSRRRWSVELGAQFSFDPGEPDVLQRVMATMRGDGGCSSPDLVYELTGNPAALNVAIASTGFNSRIVIGSWYGEKKSQLHLGGRFHRDRIQLISSQVSTIGPQWLGRWNKSRRLDVAWAMLKQVTPSRLVTHQFPISEATQAYELLDHRPEEAIQVILTY